MIETDKIIVVEGKYDVIKLQSVVSATIVTTEGFQIFRDKEKLSMLRRLAEERGLVILTDSDSAGFMIRNFLTDYVGSEYITNVYIPDIYGKEKRKTAPSAEGKLGVEGIPVDVLEEAFRRAGVSSFRSVSNGRQISRLDFYEMGLMGGPESSVLRGKLLAKLSLPARMSTSALINVINILICYDEFLKLVDEIRG